MSEYDREKDPMLIASGTVGDSDCFTYKRDAAPSPGNREQALRLVERNGQYFCACHNVPVKLVLRQIPYLDGCPAALATQGAQRDDIFWPPQDPDEENLYEIRNGKTKEYVMAHVSELLARHTAAQPRCEHGWPLPVDACPKCPRPQPPSEGAQAGEFDTRTLRTKFDQWWKTDVRFVKGTSRQIRRGQESAAWMGYQVGYQDAAGQKSK